MPPDAPQEGVRVPEPEPLQEVRTDLAWAARHLTSRERQLLRLLAQGFTHQEIAEHLGIGGKSVGARVQRLRRKLRVLLGETSNWRWSCQG